MTDKAQTIVQGEASESDDEDVEENVSTIQCGPDHITPGEVSESDEDIALEDTVQSGVQSNVNNNQREKLLALEVNHLKQGDDMPLEEPKSPRSRKSSEKEHGKYDSLLHRKLRGKNKEFRSNVIDTIGELYTKAARDIKSITQHLVKSQSSVQDVSHNMRLLTNDLFHLEDKIDIIATCKILPDINIELKPSSPLKEESKDVSSDQGPEKEANKRISGEGNINKSAQVQEIKTET